MPFQMVCESSRGGGGWWRVCVCLKGFIGDEERKGSFEEVTDDSRKTGQRKFTRQWCRAAERNFSLARAAARGSEGAFVFHHSSSAEELPDAAEKERVAEEFHSLQPTSLSPLFPAPPLNIFSFGSDHGEGAGAPGRGAHREPGRGGEAFVREATVRRRLVQHRWRRQQRSLVPRALQPAQVGLSLGKHEMIDTD